MKIESIFPNKHRNTKIWKATPPQSTKLSEGPGCLLGHTMVECSTTTVYRELHIFVNKIVDNKNENNFMTDAETEHDV